MALVERRISISVLIFVLGMSRSKSWSMDGEWMTQHMLVVLINKRRAFQSNCGFLEIILCMFTLSDCRGEYVAIVYKLIELEAMSKPCGGEGGLSLRDLPLI